jgi:tetratricopeptide (TPR) repeat protein
MEILRQKFNLLSSDGKYGDALQCLEKIKANQGATQAELDVMRGFLYLRQNQVGAAMRCFGQALSSGDDNLDQVTMLVAYAAYECGYIRYAREQYLKIVDHVDQGSWSGGWAFITLCDHELGDRQAFLADLKRTVELDPEAATSFLSTMFPQELSAVDYYAYALQHPRMGAVPYEELKD